MRPRWPWIAVIGYVAVVLQTTLVPFMSVGPVGPDVALALVLVLALMVPPFAAVLMAWAVGLARDVTGGGPLGAWAVLFAAAAGIVLAWRRKFYTRNAPARALAAWVAAAAVHLAYLLGHGLLNGRWDGFWFGVVLALGRAAYTAVAAAALAWLVGRWRRRLGLVEEPRIA